MSRADLDARAPKEGEVFLRQTNVEGLRSDDDETTLPSTPTPMFFIPSFIFFVFPY